jgi:HEAT repeat protein
MSPSEGDASPDVDTILARLDSDDRETRREAATAVSRLPLQGQTTGGDRTRHREIDWAVIRRLATQLDDPDVRVRGHVAGALSSEFGVRDLMNSWPDGQSLRTYESVVDRLFELLRDDAWPVRQTVLTPRYLHAVQDEIANAPENDETTQRWHERLAVELVDALDDPVAVVRRRAGVGLAPSEHYYPLDHAAGVIQAHPDPDVAVETVLGTLETADDEPFYLEGQSLHVSSSRVLAGLATHHPAWLEPYVDRLCTLTDRIDSDSAACLGLVETLAALPDPGPAVVDTFYRRATELFRNAESFHDQTRVLAAADGPIRSDSDAVGQACALVLPGLSDRSELVRATAAATAGRLAQTAPDVVPEVFSPLAEASTETPRYGVRTTEDPFVVLAGSHPEFVSDALDEALTRLFAETANVNTLKGMGGLLARVTAENPAVVAPLVPRLIERCAASDPAIAQGAAWGLARIVENQPAWGPEILREVLAGDGGRPPLRSGLSRIVETVASRDVETAATAVDALVTTLGLPVKSSGRRRGDSDFGRTLGAHVFAARALAAIAAADSTLGPDWARAFTPYVEDGTYGSDTNGLGGFRPSAAAVRASECGPSSRSRAVRLPVPCGRSEEPTG